MAFAFQNSRGKTYFLHSKEVTLKNGLTRSVHFFAKEERAGAVDAVPSGYQVSETRNGLPVLKKAG